MKGHGNYLTPFLYIGHNFIAHTRTKVETLSVYAHNPNAKHRTNQTNLNDPAQGSWSARQIEKKKKKEAVKEQVSSTLYTFALVGMPKF